jgi:hypothetical protein
VIQVPANATVVVMHEPINFRNGIDGTAAIARLVLEKEPMGGAFFVFRNGSETCSACWPTMGQDTGFARSGFRKAVFPRGLPATPQVAARPCSRASCRC